MKLAQALGALDVAQLQSEYWGRRSVVLPARGTNALAGLLSIEEVEVRLNDGCATLANLSVIGPSGAKLRVDELYHRQLGRAWAPVFLRKSLVHRRIAEGQSFVMHNMTHINSEVAELVADIEAHFPDFEADVHLYVSPRSASTGYRVHKDEPQHKIYLQVLGSTEWTIFKGTHPKRALTDEEAAEALDVELQVSMTPGSVLYMPPGVFHRAKNPDGPRLSVSIPISPRLATVPVDREHIPLARIFAS